MLLPRGDPNARGCRHTTQQARPRLSVMSQSARAAAALRLQWRAAPEPAWQLARLCAQAARSTCLSHVRRTMRNHCIFKEDVWKTRAKTCISRRLRGRRDFKKRRSLDILFFQPAASSTRRLRPAADWGSWLHVFPENAWESPIASESPRARLCAQALQRACWLHDRRAARNHFACREDL